MKGLCRAIVTMLALLGGTHVRAAGDDMLFIAPTNTTMPLAHFTDGQLSNGILKDLGVAIARQLGRPARFVSIPSKRVGLALRNNEADAVCYVLPQWIDGQFHWSRPLLNNSVIVIAHPDAPPIRRLQDLAGQKVGTVIGYRYPELDAALGKDFLRDDAPTTEHSFSKLAAGRSRYAIVGLSMFEYRQRTDKTFKARLDLLYATVKTQCALATGSSVSPAQFDKAINFLIDSGAVEQILSHYR